jgi:hypothetical protein
VRKKMKKFLADLRRLKSRRFTQSNDLHDLMPYASRLTPLALRPVPFALCPAPPALCRNKKRDPSGSLGNYLFNKLISGCQHVSLQRT